MSTDTGGPAFPAPDDWKRDTGMTLRDYFAAKTMQAMFTARPDTCSENPDVTARAAYAMADAMLKARNA